MKWLETAFAEDVGGALLAFRAGRHRAYLSLGRCDVDVVVPWEWPNAQTAKPAPNRRTKLTYPPVPGLYDTEQHLLGNLDKSVIAPAEAKVRELRLPADQRRP